MRRSLGWVITLLLSLVSLVSAHAADMPVKAPPLVAPAFSWSGFYVGLHGGGAWYDKEWSAPLTALNAAGGCGGCPRIVSSNNASSWLAGGQAGFNYQTGQWVLGVEADASWTSLNGSAPNALDPTIIRNTSKVDALGTVAARVGFAVNRALFYVKGGGAWADDRFYTSRTIDALLPAGTPLQIATETRWGWMVGVGVEYAFNQNWSVKGEYNHLDLGTRNEMMQPQLNCGCGTFQ